MRSGLSNSNSQQNCFLIRLSPSACVSSILPNFTVSVELLNVYCRDSIDLPLLILLINQIHHHLHHHIFLLGPTLGNHQREGNEGVVGYALVTILCVEHMVVVEKP